MAASIEEGNGRCVVVVGGVVIGGAVVVGGVVVVGGEAVMVVGDVVAGVVQAASNKTLTTGIDNISRFIINSTQANIQLYVYYLG